MGIKIRSKICLCVSKKELDVKTSSSSPPPPPSLSPSSYEWSEKKGRSDRTYGTLPCGIERDFFTGCLRKKNLSRVVF